MTDSLTISASACVDAISAMDAVRIVGFKAGETLVAGNSVYIGTDIKVMKTSASQCAGLANVPDFLGFVSKNYSDGEAVTIFGIGSRFHYADSGLVAGGKLFIASASAAGKLSDAKVASADTGVAVCLNATDILVIK